MPRISKLSCCVRGCQGSNKDGGVLHHFPNPKTNFEKFKSWVLNVTGKIPEQENASIWSRKRVCQRHFEKKHLYPTNRLCPIAIPILHMPDMPESTHSLKTEPLTSVVDNTRLETSLPVESSHSPNITAAVDNTVFDILSPDLQERTQTITLVLPSTTNINNITLDISTPAQQRRIVNLVPGLDEPSYNHNTVCPPTSDDTNSTMDVFKPAEQKEIVNIIPGLDQPSSNYNTVCQPTPNGTNSTRNVSKRVPYVPFNQQKKYKMLLKRLTKCENEKKILRQKYTTAKKMTKKTAFEIVCKKMSPTAKIFCHMQAFQGGKNQQGRRFTLEEKVLALTLYKTSTKAYAVLRNMCVLPTRRTLENFVNTLNSASNT